MYDFFNCIFALQIINSQLSISIIWVVSFSNSIHHRCVALLYG